MGTYIVLFGILGIFCIIGLLITWFNAFRSIRTPGRWFWTKLYDVLIALACLALIVFALNWHLISFNTHY